MNDGDDRAVMIGRYATLRQAAFHRACELAGGGAVIATQNDLTRAGGGE
jgi:hypothetical protein